MGNSSSKIGRKSVFSGIKKSRQRKEQSYTAEEIMLMQDHINNWNPAGHMKEYIKAKQWGKVAKILRED